MTEGKDYLEWIRSKVGKECIFLNFAGGIIENEKGEILLQKRSAAEELWGFPGGSMNLGESAEETAIREIKEETGYDVKVKELFGIYTKFFETTSNGEQLQPIVFVFKMEIIGGHKNIDKNETFDVRFFKINKAPKLYSALHRVIIDDVKAGKSGIFR